MYLSGHALNLSYLSYSNPNNFPFYYNKVTLYGKQRTSYVWIKNAILSDAELDVITDSTVPSWDDNTVFLAQFNNDYNAGNIKLGSNSATELSVERQDNLSHIRKVIGTTDIKDTNYEDLTAVKGNNYTYKLIPKSDIVTQINGNENVSVDYYNWSLVDPSSGMVFTFDLDVKNSQITEEIDRTTFPTFTKYDKVFYGQRHFAKSDLSFTLVSPRNDGSYVLNLNQVNQLEETINNGLTKIVKSPSGDIYYVDTFGFSKTYMDGVFDVNGTQPNTIQFSYQEIADSI